MQGSNMKTRLACLLASLAVVLTACGGGGGGGGGSSSSATSVTPTPPVASFVNYVPLTVNPDPLLTGRTTSVNQAFVSVKVCVPGTSQCETIDNVLLDTGSIGLRLFSSKVVSPLPQITSTDASTSGQAVAECYTFASGYMWGPLVSADVRLGDELASGIPVQLVSPASFATPPGLCQSKGRMLDVPSKLQANGILGIGHQVADCGSGCAANPGQSRYWVCNGASCTQQVLPVARQVINPVTAFATDNNGTVISLPAVPLTGSYSPSGRLYFGIGTRSNNTPANSVTVYTVDGNGQLTTTYGGNTLNESFIDSGSNGLFFPDSIAQCGSNAQGFYCPVSPLSKTAMIQGGNGKQITLAFSISSATDLFTSGNNAYVNVGGSLSSMPFSFDWGLPFYFGRTVYTSHDGATTPLGGGPYVAF